jgi:hypothetical protein
MLFKVALNPAGVVVPTRFGNAFNVMAITQLWKNVVTRGNIPVGVARIAFFNDKTLLAGSEFVP